MDLARYHGRPLLLNLWATWCPPCVAELPSLQALRDAERTRHGAGRGMEVVALDVGQSINQVEGFLASLPVPLALPVLLDPHKQSLGRWNVRVLPTTLVFDADGKLRATLLGARDWTSAAAREAIEAALRVPDTRQVKGGGRP
jgi:thiol-disulfide isomerase/thioredoxin